MTLVRRLALVGLALPLASPVQALTIEYDYSFDSGFFTGNAAARMSLEAAGDFFARRIGDSLLGIDSAGGNSFTATFINPLTSTTEQIANLDLAADTIRVIARAGLLGSNVLAQAAPGEFKDLTGTSTFQFNAVTRGQGGYGTIGGPAASDFAPWGGAITFDADTNWNFSLSSGPAANQFDFLSVALHEFGHIFGVGTAASWDNQVDFVNNRFTGAAAVAVRGSPVPVQAGANHWADGIASAVAPGSESFIVDAGSSRETAFDPTLQIGRRKLVTELDLAALADIGWEVLPQVVPLPGSALLLGGAVAALLGLRTRARPATA